MAVSGRGGNTTHHHTGTRRGMTPARFIECGGLIGWTRPTLARRMGCSVSVLKGMEDGTTPVPHELARWAEETTAYLRMHPVPPWRDRRWKGKRDDAHNWK